MTIKGSKRLISIFIILVFINLCVLFMVDNAISGTKSLDGRYEDNGNGTITDTKTGLMWTKKDSYADLGKCLEWDAAKNYVTGLRIGGHNDWRLPTNLEMLGIYEQAKDNTPFDGKKTTHIHIDKIFAGGNAYMYWTSEKSSVVDFTSGNVYNSNGVKCDKAGVRATRGKH